MLTVPAPPNGSRDGIGQAVADALGLDPQAVMLVGDDLQIPDAEGREAEVQAVVDGYTPPAPAPDPDDELDAALAAAAANATTAEKVDALIAALRGKSGRAGRAAGRPTQ